MIIAGALDDNRSNPFTITQSSKLPETPTAESTRVSLETSTDKREVREKEELLIPDGLLEKEQTDFYRKELEEAEEGMRQAYLEKSNLEKEEAERTRQWALKTQEEFKVLECKRNEKREINDKIREKIRKMDQALAKSSTFIKKMKNGDSQRVALNRALSDFWDAMDIQQETSPVKIASYPSLESLNEELKEELTEAEYEYYNKKRMILVEKMAMANDIYLAHLQNYEQQDPKDRSQRYLLQFNELSEKLHEQFDIVAERLRLPLEQSLMRYPSLGNLMDLNQQEDMGNKNRKYFQEIAKEVKIKNDIAQKVLNNRL